MMFYTLSTETKCTAAAEALKKWDDGRVPRGLGKGLATSPVTGFGGVTPANLGANLCIFGDQ